MLHYHEKFTVSIPGDPIGKGRPLGSIRGGRVHMRTPAPTAAWESRAAWLCRSEWKKPPMEGLLAVAVHAVTPRPINRPDDIPSDVWRSGSGVLRVIKPDVDNIAKAALDALVLAKVIGDDSQVALLTASRMMAAAGEDTRVEITARRVTASERVDSIKRHLEAAPLEFEGGVAAPHCALLLSLGARAGDKWRFSSRFLRELEEELLDLPHLPPEFIVGRVFGVDFVVDAEVPYPALVLERAR